MFSISARTTIDKVLNLQRIGKSSYCMRGPTFRISFKDSPEVDLAEASKRTFILSSYLIQKLPQDEVSKKQIKESFPIRIYAPYDPKSEFSFTNSR